MKFLFFLNFKQIILPELLFYLFYDQSSILLLVSFFLLLPHHNDILKDKGLIYLAISIYFDKKKYRNYISLIKKIYINFVSSLS
jgi:hypothetical protein